MKKKVLKQAATEIKIKRTSLEVKKENQKQAENEMLKKHTHIKNEEFIKSNTGEINK